MSFVLLLTRYNGNELVMLNLGFRTFYRVPLAWVAVGSLLMGMGVMLLAGLHADLKVRRFLRDRLAREEEEGREPLRDLLQQDLFLSAPPEADPDVSPDPAVDPEPRSETQPP